MDVCEELSGLEELSDGSVCHIASVSAEHLG
jgi:hypothetical protein